MESQTKILIVEHDRFDIELVHQELAQSGINYITEVVQKEESYVNALKTFIPDIILSDYSLPYFTGMLAFKLKMEIAPQTPFIFVSGTIGEERSIELIRTGVTDYVLKDNIITLIPKVKRALREAEEKQLIAQTSLELKQSEKKYRQIIETSQEGIWLIDENNITILVNQKMADILGYSIEEMMGKHYYYFMDDEAQERASKSIVNRKLGISENLDVKYITKSGKTVWTSLSANPMFDDAGVYTGALAMVTDISELKESEQRYSDLFQLSPQPMWIFETSTLQFMQVNKATISLYGYSEQEFLEMTVPDIMQHKDAPNAEDHFDGIDQDKDIFSQTAFHRKKSGQIIEVEIYSSLLVLNNKTFTSVIAFDVTEKKLYDIKLTKAIIKTQEDERYEIGSELHDNVCQILAVSQINLSMIKKSLAQSELLWLNKGRENIKLALIEIRDLSHRLAPVFLDESTLEDALRRLFTPFLVKQGSTFLLHVDEKTHPIGDELKLNIYRILQEQFRNIQKHADATLIDVDVAVGNNLLRIRTTDNGVGFDTKKLRDGIGLANMKRRAALFGGNFEMNSSPGNGCEVKITIPLPIAN